MNDENLSKALSSFIEAMRLFTVSMIQKHFQGSPWEGEFFSRLTADKQQMWLAAMKNGTQPIHCVDFHNLTFLCTKFKDEMYIELNKDMKNVDVLKSKLIELNNVRNKVSHFNPLTDDERESVFVNIKSVANLLGMPDLRDEIARLQGQSTSPQATAHTTKQQQPAATVHFDDQTPLVPWHVNCIPHYDIRTGNLDESVFAANLNEVAMSVGPEAYSDASLFFAKTFITQGMRDIAGRVVRALNGQVTENRIISLQTGFGGGKTHTLISLYHIVRNGVRLLGNPSCKNLLPAGVEPQFTDARVAVFTNNTTDVANGRQTTDGLTLRTLWGEIAYQLGGVAAYEQIRLNDEQRIAPTSTVLKPILEQAGTSLILIDELADYCIKASAQKVGDSNLFMQTNSFMQALTETVAQVPRCMLIATLPASVTELGNEQIASEILMSLEARIVRIGTNIQPVNDDEIYEVIRRRLFDEIYSQAKIDNAIAAYQKLYQSTKSELPDNATHNDYAQRLRKSYPFHPELIDMFHHRWGGDPHFQRTRGVLRILASIVQDLWRRRTSTTGAQLLIHTSDVHLENLDTLTGTLTRLMGNTWESVLSADVRGSSSNAYQIDQENEESSRLRITQGVATTILLASVGSKGNRGLKIRQTKLCMVRPNSFKPSEVDTAINKLSEVAHYLHSSQTGEKAYWFDSKANINNLITQMKASIQLPTVDDRIIESLKTSVANCPKVQVLVAPTADIPEQRRLTMIIMHPRYAANNTLPDNLRETIMTFATKRGNSDRVVRNTIFYLACSKAGREKLNDITLEILACEKVLAEFGNSLEVDQQHEIAKRKIEKNQNIGEALVRAFSVVIRFQAEVGKYELKLFNINNFEHDMLSQISNNILGRLREEDLLLGSIGQQTLRDNNLFPTIENPVKVKSIYEAFLNNADKPMITGPEAVIETVNRYCNQHVFNVAVRSGNEYSIVYQGHNVHFLSVDTDDYWLVDKSVVIKQPDTSPSPNPQPEPTPQPTPIPQPTDTPQPKKYKRIVIHGHVPIENWTQLFTSFVNILKGNNLKIEISFTAKSTATNPLTENSPTISSVRESASQLGLDFDTEEE